MMLAHKIALDPTYKQRNALCRASGVARFTWNWALAEWKKDYQADNKPSGNSLKVKFNQLKRSNYPWVYGSPKNANQRPFAHLQKAFNSFFKKLGGYPKFKKRGEHDSFYISNDRLRLANKKIRLPKIGWIKLRESLRFNGKIMSATVSRKADRWYVSIQVDLGEFSKSRTSDNVVGVDLGIKHAVVLSDGRVYDAPNPLRRSLAQLRRVSKSLSRKRRGSKRRHKTRNRLARIHHRISHIRSDFLHKLTTRLCSENQTVVIEDLDVKEMMRKSKTKRFGKAIADVGFHEFRRQLTYKSEIYGTTLIVADRWFPSTKTCSSCGYTRPTIALSERVYVCECCGFTENRDLNAAKNLKQLADGLSVIARGDDSSTVGLTPTVTTVCETRTKQCSLVSTR